MQSHNISIIKYLLCLRYDECASIPLSLYMFHSTEVVRLIQSGTIYSITISRGLVDISRLITLFSRFIETYGTHIVVGVKMGGKDVIYLKQLQNSNLEPTEVQKLLKQLADERFSEDVNGSLIPDLDKSSGKKKVFRILDSKPFSYSSKPTHHTSLISVLKQFFFSE